MFVYKVIVGSSSFSYVQQKVVWTTPLYEGSCFLAVWNALGKTIRQKFHRLCIGMAKTRAGAKIPRSVMKKICLLMPRGTFQGLWRTSQSKKAIICESKMPVVVLGGWREVSLGISEHMPFKVCFTGFSQSELLIIREFSRFSNVWAHTRPPSMS